MTRHPLPSVEEGRPACFHNSRVSNAYSGLCLLQEQILYPLLSRLIFSAVVLVFRPSKQCPAGSVFSVGIAHIPTEYTIYLIPICWYSVLLCGAKTVQ